ncbi:unnamed protein product [Protopolystoma xenopodis]|uniref:PDZ domain-containing protein n=1 Tax=Protopolystoma xenopodis TaxID=117903 RepID=A0A448X518_9PLAT|nr:unnamed protein product [Protopolystoma xenopodis]
MYTIESGSLASGCDQLRPGDRITSINSVPVVSLTRVVDLFAAAGSTARLGIIRQTGLIDRCAVVTTLNSVGSIEGTTLPVSPTPTRQAQGSTASGIVATVEEDRAQSISGQADGSTAGRTSDGDGAWRGALASQQERLVNCRLK